MDLSEPLSPACGSSDVLAGVVAYVEVWSSNRTENYSTTFSQQLLNLGAKVSKTFNKLVTHVIFKDGNQGTWDKAIKNNVKLVSVLWVEKCRELGTHVDESLYLPINTNEGLPQLLKKKRKCMQPKDFVEKTPENDRRLQRKFNKLCKELDEQKTSVDVPVLVFDETGELMYSPKAIVDRCNAMEKRIKEMKSKRENLSPTASQMSQTFDFHSLKPSIGNSPSVVRDSPHDDDVSHLDTSYDELWGPSKIGEDCSFSKNKKEEISPYDDCASKHSSNKLVTLTTQVTESKNGHSESNLQNKDRKSLQKHKMFDTEIDESRNDVSNDKFSKKQEISRMEYIALANSLTAKCKEKCNGKKAESPSLKSKFVTTISSASKKRDMMLELTKPGVSSKISDSESNCFEDFFTSFSSHSRKLLSNRLSLGALPPKSPSLSSLTSKKKRLLSSEDFECDNSIIKKRRKSHHTVGLISEPHVNPSYTQICSPDVETVNTCPKKTIRRASSHQRKGTESPTVDHLHVSEVPLNGHNTLKKAHLGNSQMADSAKNMCHVKGFDEVLTLIPCKTVGVIEPKDESLTVTTSAFFENEMESSKKSTERTKALDTVDGLSDIFHKQRNKGTLESRKTDKTKKTTRSLVMTSMPSEKQNTLIQVVKKFGGFVFTDHVCDTTTHVIAGNPRRTLNILLGLARGCWVLSFDWVLWSLECGHWIPEEPYELSDHFPGAPVS
ncbi:microcephalin isoform X1 [Pelobates cultripes]|uniref:Microcephalin isoform X1 n=1 Tax=Pelobates cultripes TaxID=61616 RepID=A0AAD1VU34_PELCU|nr:microcephalin isoform X1 [Pelobates cultripes]